MKFGDTIRRSLRSLAQAKARTFLTAAALAVGGFTLTLTLAAANGARAYTDKLVSDNFDPSSLVVVKDPALLSTDGGFTSQPQAYDESLTSIGTGFVVKTLDQNDLEKIAALPSVESIFVDYQTTPKFISLSGNDELRFTGMVASYDPSLTQTLAAGTAGSGLNDTSVLIPESYVDLFKFSSATDAVGKSVTVELANGETFDFTIAGVIKKPATSLVAAGSSLLLSESAARDLYAASNNDQVRITNIYARAEGGSSSASLATTKQAIEAAGYAAQSVEDTQKLIGQIINVLQVIILVFGAITLIASFFGVINTQYISVLERTREIGLMKALGLSRNGVSRLFILEATWIGFLGALLGSAVAVGVGTLLNPTISAAINFENADLLVFNYLQIAALIGFLMLVTTIAGLLPARKAAKLDPIVALRTE